MSWIDVADRTRIPPRGMLEVAAGRAAILLYDLDGTIHATTAICSHHAAWLSQGRIDGDCIDCPRHFGQFHIPTGAWRRGPACPPLRTYPVQLREGRVLVDIG
jgi:nitrite reductase/ring-hydroxylating ferredoxin subunit